MATKQTYLQIDKDRVSPSGLTFVWVVKSLSGIPLGEIKWFGQWRKYTFYPMNYTTWDDNCLNEISAFMTKANAEHAERKR